MSDSERIARLIRDLYGVVADLERIAPGRLFTPDGGIMERSPRRPTVGFPTPSGRSEVRALRSRL